MNSSFNREKYLLRILTAIFAFQATIFALGLTFCARNGGLKACPEIGRRYDSTFQTMTAVVLSLLGAGAVTAAVSSSKKKEDEPPVRGTIKEGPPKDPSKETYTRP